MRISVRLLLFILVAVLGGSTTASAAPGWFFSARSEDNFDVLHLSAATPASGGIVAHPTIVTTVCWAAKTGPPFNVVGCRVEFWEGDEDGMPTNDLLFQPGGYIGSNGRFRMDLSARGNVYPDNEVRIIFGNLYDQNNQPRAATTFEVRLRRGNWPDPQPVSHTDWTRVQGAQFYFDDPSLTGNAPGQVILGHCYYVRTHATPQGMVHQPDFHWQVSSSSFRVRFMDWGGLLFAGVFGNTGFDPNLGDPGWDPAHELAIQFNLDELDGPRGQVWQNMPIEWRTWLHALVNHECGHYLGLKHDSRLSDGFKALMHVDSRKYTIWGTWHLSNQVSPPPASQVTEEQFLINLY